MSKREEGICIWIHHIATGLGVIMGMAGMAIDIRIEKEASPDGCEASCWGFFF